MSFSRTSIPSFYYVIVQDVAAPNAFDELLNPILTSSMSSTLHPLLALMRVTRRRITQEPAIKGTVSVLKTTKEFGSNVKKVVITSSFAAVIHTNPTDDPNFVYTEGLE